MKALTNVQLEHVASTKLGIRGLYVVWTKPDLEAALDEMERFSFLNFFIWNDSPGGTHWVVVYIDRTTKTAYVFNPMGLPLDKPALDALKKRPNLVKNVVWNDAAVQASDSETCGHWCLYFIVHMIRNVRCNQNSDAKAVYESLMDSLSVDDYARNEAFIKKWWTRFCV